MSKPDVIPEHLAQTLKRHSQDHVLASWDRLVPKERQELISQLDKLNFDLLDQLYRERDCSRAPVDPARLRPIPIVPTKDSDPQTIALGETALTRGEVAVLMVAGGQGSRLGFEHPKGMFPVGPVSQKTLFQLHAEKVRALRRAYHKPIPFLIMTSPDNHVETVEFFRENGWFGLIVDELHFFRQGVMPALDYATGKLLLEAPGRLFLSPNGHGGSLTSLAEHHLLERLMKHGIRHLFYFQVDNPLVHVAEPGFLGQHLAEGSQVSTKIVRKNAPEDRLGNLVLMDGRCGMIEYSDLSADLAQERDGSGGLRYQAGNTAIHIFDVEFLDRVAGDPDAMPFHVARKKVPCVTPAGDRVDPAGENALKFEKFVFDVLPRAERWLVAETTRAEEFEPLKNARGAESPDSVRRALCNRAGHWLESAGVRVPRGADNQVAAPLEISPLYALNREELAARVDRSLRVEGSLHLE